MAGAPSEYPPDASTSPEQAGTPAPVLNLQVIAEQAAACPPVRSSEWTFINASPTEAPTRLATVLLLHAVPEVDLDEVGEYFHLRNLVDDLSQAQRRTTREKDVQAQAEERLGKVATFGQIAGFMAVALSDMGKVAAQYRKDYEGIGNTRDDHELHRARLRQLLDRTDRPNNPILKELAVLRRGSDTSRKGTTSIQAERLIRLLLLGGVPQQTVQ